MNLDALASGMIRATTGMGWQAANLLKSKHKNLTVGRKTPKTKRKAQRFARRIGRAK